MASKRKQRNYKMTTTTELDYKRVIKIGIGVILVLVLVYFVTALSSGEIKLNKKEDKKETSIGYQEIIAGETYNRKADSYYVLYFNFTDSKASYYLSLIDSYNKQDNSLPFYIVDLEKKINEEYINSNLKVSHPTILKISNSNIVETITGHENIKNFLNMA